MRNCSKKAIVMPVIMLNNSVSYTSPIIIVEQASCLFKTGFYGSQDLWTPSKKPGFYQIYRQQQSIRKKPGF